MPRELKLPGFTPTPVFIDLLDGGDDTFCTANLEFDETVCEDVDSFHKSPVVIMHQADWDAFMEKVRELEFLYVTEEMRAGAIEASRDQHLSKIESIDNGLKKLRVAMIKRGYTDLNATDEWILNTASGLLGVN